jgi:DNA-binding HxlR family transcriptional regulator
MERTNFQGMRCSIARALDLVGEWWSPLILRDLYLGVGRFDEIIEDLGISRNLLTSRLAALIDAGVVTKKPYQTRPVRYEYALTEAGAEFVPVLVALSAWGDRWAPTPKGPPIRYLHQRCGCRFEPRIRCSQCGEDLVANQINAVAGPGGAAKRGTRVVARRLMGERRT